jgi:SAM-dependent methyltransferase
MSDIVDVEQYFTRAAAAFDSLYTQERVSPVVRFLNRNFRRDIYERFVLSIQHVRQNGLRSVLDVGCGSGRYAYAFAELGVKRIIGIDISPAMIELAKKLIAGAQRPNASLEFICGDFMQFKADESFDVVIAMGFFDYVSDALPVLSRMKRLATHSVIASFPSVSWYRTPVRKVRYRFKRCPVYFYEYESIVRLAKQAGFPRYDVHKIEGAGQDYFVALYNEA